MTTFRAMWTGSKRGQGLVEFAFVLPVLALLLLGILQFAFIFGTQVGLTNAAREAARTASVLRTDTLALALVQGPGVVTRLETVILPQNVQAYASSSLDSTETKVCYQAFSDVSLQIAVKVRVTVKYDHPLFIPFISDLVFGGSGGLPITVSEEFPVENPPIPSTDIPSVSWTCYS